MFHDVSGFKGAFNIVKVAKNKPHRYGKRGELLINYDDTEEGRRTSLRRSSVATGPPGTEKTGPSDPGHQERVEDVEKKL
jgi:hypothetical protein